ncbi:MAG: uroporphyrinogen-III C-methyltransferase [Rudaea sp.]
MIDPDNETTTSLPEPIVEPAVVQASRPQAPKRGGSLRWSWLLWLVVLGAAGYFFWQLQAVEQGHDLAAHDEQAAAQKLRDQVDALQRDSAAARHDGEGLRARLDDAAKVNESLRGQLLGLSERARLAEDAIANLADKRLSGHDSLLLNEAELLLVLGGERFRLFHDPAPALAAYRLADAALVETNNAAFSTIRQSINAEITALGTMPALSSGAIEEQLGQLRSRLAQLPVATGAVQQEAEPASRWAQVFGQFVRVSRDDETRAMLSRSDPLLARALVDASLRDAQAALLLRDTTLFRRALVAARAQLSQAFDVRSNDVRAALVELDALGKPELSPPAPEVLGAALKELRNLRATQALQPDLPRAPAPAAAAPATTGDKT